MRVACLAMWNREICHAVEILNDLENSRMECNGIDIYIECRGMGWNKLCLLKTGRLAGDISVSFRASMLFTSNRRNMLRLRRMKNLSVAMDALCFVVLAGMLAA